MIESPVEKGNIQKYAKELLISPRTAERWWKTYQKTGEVPYRKSKSNPGSKATISVEPEDFINELLDKDCQLFVDDLVEKLTYKSENFTISKSQLNHHLKNHILVTVKKPYFEAEARNSVINLQKRFEMVPDLEGHCPRLYSELCIG